MIKPLLCNVGTALLHISEKIKPPSDKTFLSIDGSLFGGGEENRTPVRKSTHKSLYECRLYFGVSPLAAPIDRLTAEAFAEYLYVTPKSTNTTISMS